MGGTTTGTSGTETPRPKGRPGRKPKGSVPVVVPETPDKPDPDHVLTWRQRKVLQVIRVAALLHGFPDHLEHLALPPGQHVVGIGLVRRLRDNHGHAALRLAPWSPLGSGRLGAGSAHCGASHGGFLHLMTFRYPDSCVLPRD